MSTEQELAAVAEAIKAALSGPGTTLNFGPLSREVAPFAIAAIDKHRAEQASAGDRDAVDKLIDIARAATTIGGSFSEYEEGRAARAAVLARMQRPVIDEAMVERFHRAFYDILVTSGWTKSDEFKRIRVALEAALREEGEA